MPAKERSPRYPSVSLGEAIDLARRHFEKNGRTAVPAAVLAKVWGYKSASGPMRSKLGAVKSYGLLAGSGDKVSVTPRLLALVMANPATDEYKNALRAAATDPPIFQELLASHSEADENAIRYHLVSERHFTSEGARKLAETFRETMALAGLARREYADPQAVEPSTPSSSAPRWLEQSARNTGSVTVSDGSVYRWPLGRNMSAEVVLTSTSGPVTPMHLKRLRQFLELAEAALDADAPTDDEAPE